MCSEKSFIGLEYVVEIQHNTAKKMQANYSCLLCDFLVKEKNKNNTASNIELAKGHIKSTSHRLKYLVRLLFEKKNLT